MNTMILTLNTYIEAHCLPLQSGCRAIKQKLRCIKLKWNAKIKEEVVKLLELDFLQVTDYPEWLANIVPVHKKTGKSECVSFTEI